MAKIRNMVKKYGAGVKKWAKNEEGFEIFERFGITQGGVLMVLGAVAVALTVMNDYWGQVGNRYFSTDTGIDGLAPGMEGAYGWDADSTGWQ